MRTTIYLVRHAEATNNTEPLVSRQENKLTDKGLKQAENVAKHFRHTNIAGIYTSPILRTKQTAAIIGQAKSIETTTLDFVRERSGTYIDKHQYKHTETFADLNVRLEQTIQFIKDLPDKRFVIVSHAIFIKSLLTFIMANGKLEEDLFEQISNTLVIDNATVTEVVYNHKKQTFKIL